MLAQVTPLLQPPMQWDVRGQSSSLRHQAAYRNVRKQGCGRIGRLHWMSPPTSNHSNCLEKEVHKHMVCIIRLVRLVLQPHSQLHTAVTACTPPRCPPSRVTRYGDVAMCCNKPCLRWIGKALRHSPAMVAPSTPSPRRPPAGLDRQAPYLPFLHGFHGQPSRSHAGPPGGLLCRRRRCVAQRAIKQRSQAVALPLFLGVDVMA